jgi:hypothetical protein
LRRSLAFALGALLSPTAALAAEGGGTIWIPGQFASFAASPDAPGWQLQTTSYFSRATTPSGLVTFARGGARVSGRTEVQAYHYLSPGYTFETPVLGGQFYVGATGSYGWMDVNAEAVFSRRSGRTSITATSSASEDASGVSDVTPLASLKWQFGSHNVMTYVTGNIPTGYFDPNSLAGISSGYWALDGGAAYTYDPGNGLEFSITAGATYNFMNPSTVYQSGVDGHIEVGASWAIAPPSYVGGVGYLLNQLSDDIGAPADLGGHRSRVAGVGPQMGWSFRVSGVEVDVNLRGYTEFAAQNRPEGFNVWLSLTFQAAR